MKGDWESHSCLFPLESVSWGHLPACSRFTPRPPLLFHNKFKTNYKSDAVAAVGSLWGLEKQRQWWPPLPTVFYSMGPIPSIIIIHHHMRPLYCLKKIENFPRPLFINYSFIISYKSKFPHTRHLIGCNLLKSCLGPTWKAKSVKFLCKKQEPLTLWMYSVYSLPLTFRKNPNFFQILLLASPCKAHLCKHGPLLYL